MSCSIHSVSGVKFSELEKLGYRNQLPHRQPLCRFLEARMMGMREEDARLGERREKEKKKREVGDKEDKEDKGPGGIPNGITERGYFILQADSS